MLLSHGTFETKRANHSREITIKVTWTMQNSTVT
jgi:hypothetical protein